MYMYGVAWTRMGLYGMGSAWECMRGSMQARSFRSPISLAKIALLAVPELLWRLLCHGQGDGHRAAIGHVMKGLDAYALKAVLHLAGAEHHTSGDWQADAEANHQGSGGVHPSIAQIAQSSMAAS